MTAERRHPRQAHIPGGRRASDPIVDLDTEPRRFLALTPLATYWGVSRRFLVTCAESGLLTVHVFAGSEWRVKTTNARAFEHAQIYPAKLPSLQPRAGVR